VLCEMVLNLSPHAPGGKGHAELIENKLFALRQLMGAQWRLGSAATE
jgi:hypothetical protein